MRGDYDVTYADERKTVLLKADLSKGWRRLEKTYGFFRQMWIWYRGDLRVRTMLTLLAQPATFHQSAAEFPDITLRGGNELTNYEIREKKLVLSVALREDQPWRLMIAARPNPMRIRRAAPSASKYYSRASVLQYQRVRSRSKSYVMSTCV